MTIPEVQRWLLGIANGLAIKPIDLSEEVRNIRSAVKELSRRRAVRKTRVKARPATPALRDRIRAYAEEHPDMNNREIGRVFNVDGGRVSEALAGFRR